MQNLSLQLPKPGMGSCLTPCPLHYRGKEVERSWTPSEDTPGCDPVVRKWPGRSWPPPKSHKWTQAAPLAPSGASWTGMLRPSGPFGEQMEETLDQQRHSIPRGCRIGPNPAQGALGLPQGGRVTMALLNQLHVPGEGVQAGQRTEKPASTDAVGSQLPKSHKHHGGTMDHSRLKARDKPSTGMPRGKSAPISQGGKPGCKGRETMQSNCPS